MPLLQHLLRFYLIRCFNCCQPNLKWKVLLLMGRVCAFEGKGLLMQQVSVFIDCDGSFSRGV